MITFHPVEIDSDLDRNNPLYVGNFFKLKGMWWKKRKQRQGLILSIASAWYRLMKSNPSAPGFINEEVLITSLTKQVGDARAILEHFFDITRIGFNFGDGNKSPTLISPKKLDKDIVRVIRDIIDTVRFAPGPQPILENLTKSTVEVQKHRDFFIRQGLKKTNREDLLPAVNWLLLQEYPLTFFYARAGTLLERDKSVWPIKSIEMWPGWLRAELFGTVVDIENAYCQFVVKKLEEKYKDNPTRLELKYPDLLRSDRDKQNFRDELCRDYLKLELNDENNKVVKKLIMSIANGSNATPMLMVNGSNRSEAVRIVREAAPNLSSLELLKVGARLSIITKQFRGAKRDLCIFLLGAKPSRENQKRIYKMYFSWEREARHSIWKACNNTGLHLHDAVEGVITNLTNTELITLIAHKTSVRVSVDSPNTTN